MSEIVVDARLREQLLAATAGAELRDEQGRKLGRFVPEYDPALFDIPDLDLSEDEVRSLLSPDRKTYTTEEVMAYLRSLK